MVCKQITINLVSPIAYNLVVDRASPFNMLPAIWDYIVVGGGLAGTTLSNRLLGYNSSLQILLIEAGGDASHDPSILYENSTNLVHGTYDWAYLTTAQENLDNRHIDAPAGRCLGGGTAINGCE